VSGVRFPGKPPKKELEFSSSFFVLFKNIQD